MRVGQLAVGRAGDKGPALDLTLVAVDEAAYRLLERSLTSDVVAHELGGIAPGPVVRYEVPGLLALKYVLPQALPGGVYATLHAGLHWQKAAIHVLLDLELPGSGEATAGEVDVAAQGGDGRPLAGLRPAE